jgi:hypothetical protein
MQSFELISIKLHRYKCLAITLLVLCLYMPPSITSAKEATSFPEGKVKAALIYNFMRFVDWPENDAVTGELCVLGTNKEYLSALNFLSKQHLKNTHISLRMISPNKEESLESCQVVFVTSHASKEQTDNIKKLVGKPTLIISDETNFLGSSGMINFVKNQRKVGFEVNLANVQAANIRISSKVLRLAEKVIQ